MGNKRNSFSEGACRPAIVPQQHSPATPTPPQQQQQQLPQLQQQQWKPELCNGAVQTSAGHCNRTGTELIGSGVIQDGGDTSDLAEWNAEKASQWLGTGELEVVRPETHPEAFVPVAPDGGWSWVVLLASFSSSVIIDGITFSIGLLLSDLTECFKPPKAKVALVGSLFLGCYQIIGPVVAALINRFGCRAVAITGSLLATAAMFASSFAPSMDVLLCTFGVIGGSSFGLIYLPAMISVNYYFSRRRAMANGIAVVGTPVGAVIFGPLTSYLLQVYHWSNTLIIFAGLLLHCVAFACLYRPLKPAVHIQPVHSHSIPEGLDEFIAEELQSGYFTSNGYIRSVPTFASTTRIVQPLMEVDEPAVENESRWHSFTPNVAAARSSDEDKKSKGKQTDQPNDELKQASSQRDNADDNNILDMTKRISICRSDSNKSALSAPSVLSVCSRADEDGREANDDEVAAVVSGALATTVPVKKFDEQKAAESRKHIQQDEPNSAKEPCDKDRQVAESTAKIEQKQQKTELDQPHFTPNIPLLQIPSDAFVNKDSKTRRMVPVSCILSTPCLSGFQDQFCRDPGSSIEPGDGNSDQHRLGAPRHRHRYRRRHHYYQLPRNNPIPVNRQISTSRILKHPSGIPTIEEGHILENVRSNQATAGEQMATSGGGGGGGARDYSSSITVAGATRDFIRRHRFRGSPSINSGAQLHHSALSGLTNVTCKFELVRMDSKPAVVILPHPDLSIRDYSRPMYRSDIFYSGNVAPELLSASYTPATRKLTPQGVGSQLLASDFIGSGFSLRPESLSRRVSVIRRDSNARISLSVDPEAGAYLSQPNNCLESYMVSLTNIPCGPGDYGEEIDQIGRCWCCKTAATRLLCCTMRDDFSDDEDSVQNISLGDCCLTCLRRLRDCRLPLIWKRSKPAQKMFTKTDRRESTTYSAKFEAGGDRASERTSHMTPLVPYRSRICASKAFTDVLGNMTDLQLLRNRGYQVAFLANFFGVLGTYVPLIYVTEFAAQNNIPEHMCSYLISIMGLLSIVGRLAFVWFSALLGIRPIITQTVTQILSGLLIALMPLFVNFASQATAFGLMGLLSGPLASLSTIILCDLVGIDALTTAVGLVTLSRGLSSALGAPLAGILHEWTGNFTIPYVMSGMTIIFSGVLFGIIIWLPSYSSESSKTI